jgi:hypothetical protein
MEAEKAGLFNKGQMGQSLSAMANRGELGLADQANISTDGNRPESWATPKASDPQHSGPNMRDSAGNYALPAQAVKTSLALGKLNPRWVETLMGVPVGWTMASCASPVTIEQTNFGSSATESSQIPQPELF